ncbi:hypothetical protein J2W22_003017 [Sphingomonas kyeonggiensis]|uniref:phage tail assembly protein n=1 Tax=Sphingomonas kyeonggiensis TaxID=1268553 RepID=UPI002787B7A0|nr:phage tail assembly protein [Sphingomonas kyeonggiensis]MDQ0250953.1 hypothetical protein [Sphingomonas kyeonggiensis]
MSKPVKIANVPLEEPIARGETSIETLQLRKPMSGELRGLTLVDLTQLKTDTVIKLLPRISNPPITEIEAAGMDPADLLQCGVEIGCFFLTAAMRAENPGL